MNEGIIIGRYRNKTVKIFLKNSYCYTGKVIEITDRFIVLKDQFDLDVTLPLDSINTIVELKGGGKVNGN